MNNFHWWKNPQRKDRASSTNNFLKFFIYNRVESKTSPEIWKVFYSVIFQENTEPVQSAEGYAGNHKYKLSCLWNRKKCYK